MICGKTELCIFDPAPAQSVVESAVYADIHPTTLIDGKSTNIEFLINASETEYLDLNDTMLYVRLQVKTKKGQELPENAAVTPVNYFFYSLFNDVVLSLNDTVIEGGNHMYAYKSVLESMFNFAEDTKRIQLEPTGYSEMDNIRKGWIAKSKFCDLAGALRLDFFNQPRYLIPGVNARLQLLRSKPGFSVVAKSSNPVLEIKKAILYVRRVKVNRAVALGHELGLLKSNALYPLTRSKIVSYTIAKGSLSYFKDNIFSAMRLPKFVIVCLVGANSFNGDYNSDPFNFQHFNVNSVGLLYDGQSVPFREFYEPDFQNNLYTRDYMISIIQNTEHFNTNRNNGITMENFASKGQCFFTFNLTPDWNMSGCQVPRDGNLRLDLSFAKPLDEGINVILYALFDDEIQIGKNKQVIKSTGL